MQLTAIALSLSRAGMLHIWTPRSLFSANEPGVWFDPSDLSTLFQDSAGTTPVTAVEQPVGLMLDKSGRGNHATQTTSTSRPVLSARYNLLTNTETLSTQSVTTQATNYKLRFTGAGTITLSGTKTGVYTAGTYTLTGVTAGTLTLTVAGSVTQADIRPANLSASLPAYQRVNTATDYDTVGFPKYLKFDGSDDWMVTPTITPGIDKVQVFAGVRKLSDAASAVALELGTDVATNNGSFNLIVPSSAGANSYRITSKGTLSLVAGTLPFAPAPDTAVITGVGNISGDVSQLKRNGVVIETSTADQGTGNYLAYPLYIGARAGTSYPFNGHIYSMIVRFGANLDTTTIEQTENWVNAKTLAY